MELRDLILLKLIKGGGSSLVEETATGNPVGFDTEVAKPLKSLVVPLTYSQEGTGDPSPTNIRPITGVSSLFCVHAKKNIGYLRGYSTANVKYDQAGTLSNNYGTTISTTDPESSVTITQSDATTDYGKSNYRNGYFSIRTDNMVDGQRYDISFKVTNITSNPLNASLSDWMAMPGQGSGGNPSEVKGDVLIWKNQLYREATLYRQAYEVRNCGMSCTVSEFMITPANTTDGVYEAYDGARLDVMFPALGKNKFNKYCDRYMNMYLNSDGTTTGNANWAITDYIPIAGNSVTVSGIGGGSPSVCAYDADKNYLTGASYNTGGYDIKGSVTLTSETEIAYVRLSIYTAVSEYADQIQLEEGSSASAYEPYNNSVYGGSLDLVSGVLTIEWESKSAKWGDIRSGAQHQSTGYYQGTITFDRNLMSAIKPSDYGERILCNICNLVVWDGTGYSPEHIYVPSSAPNIARIIGNYDTDTTIQMVCKLATPIAVQLTPAQASAFVGDNTVWTNTTGDLTVKYYDKQ